MKANLTSLLSAILMINLGVQAQSTSNLEIFSENGEPFFLSINGVKQNNDAESNVKATGLSGEFFKVNVRFADNTLGSVAENVGIQAGYEQRAIITTKKNGSMVIRPFGEPVALSEVKPSPARVAAPETYMEQPLEQTVAKVTAPSTVTTTTTTTTNGVAGGSATETVRMDVGIGGQSFGINVEINDPTMTTHGTTVQTQKVEVRTEEVRHVERSPAPAKEEVVSTCAPMDASTFASAKKSIAAKSFAEEQQTTARQILRGNCMSTDQVMEVMGLFSFEENKLEFAKAAYDRCSDPNNYWKVNDAFTFSDSIEELDAFLQKK
jgi:hypothetical protein